MDGARRYRLLVRGGIALIVLFFVSVLSYSYLFGPAGSDATTQQFVITPGESLADVAGRLKAAGLTRNSIAIRFAYAAESGSAEVKPGGYELSTSMDVWTLASTLTRLPYLAWVTVPPGYRKEQIGELLAKDLSWTQSEEDDWDATATDPSSDFEEGVYYPDTYLIPSDQTPEQIAERMRDRFSNVFAPYAAEAAAENIPWTNVLTLASLIEREAAGPDMKLIAGILWNRLNNGMALQVDASLQYATGTPAAWWPVVHSDDKYIDSPFNTYEHTGLPPHPIAEPSLAAIDAVLNPATTTCIYYLHDPTGQIHCSQTYAGQVANVDTYLK